MGLGFAVLLGIASPGHGAERAQAAGEGPQWPNVSGGGEGAQWPNLAGQSPQLSTVQTMAARPNPRAASKAAASEEITTTGASFDPPRERPRPALAPERLPPRFIPPKPEPAFKGELGIRYWVSWSQASLDLYNIAGTALVSKLTYEGMNGHNAEVFGRFDHNNGFYLKTYLGGGWLVNGRLVDEDFPPVISPYSKTYSDQRGGTMAYGAVDIGYNIFDEKTFRLGAFAGYHFLMERVSAFGCQQAASNPLVCGGGVPDSIEVITQNNTWQSLRVGVDADLRLTKEFTLSADAAYLPVVGLFGTDRHLLRIGTAPGDFTGGIPEDGTGWGYQLEAALSYAASENASFAIGGRYWHMETQGNAHFENNVVGFTAFPQRLDWKTDHYGVFVQGSFKFGPYPTGSLY
jgi:hypothetical protein